MIATEKTFCMKRFFTKVLLRVLIISVSDLRADKGQTPKFVPHVRYTDFPCDSCLHSTPFMRSAQPEIKIER